MKPSRCLFGLVVAISIYTLSTAVPVLAQSQSLEANRNLVSTGPPAKPPMAPGGGKPPVDATATVVDDSGAPVVTASRKGIFGLVGLKHDHTVDVAVQYPVARAGRNIHVEALDGGQVIANAKNLTVAADGKIEFKFRAGHDVGVYHIALRDGTEELGLQFWVLDEEHPEKNRPVINPKK